MFNIRYFKTFIQVLIVWVTFSVTKVLFKHDVFSFTPASGEIVAARCVTDSMMKMLFLNYLKSIFGISVL